MQLHQHILFARKLLRIANSLVSWSFELDIYFERSMDDFFFNYCMLIVEIELIYTNTKFEKLCSVSKVSF